MAISTAQAEGEIRLVLQLMIDGLRADLPARSLDQFGDGGFRYLLDPDHLPLPTRDVDIDGDNLNVRYRIDQNNTDKWAGSLGMMFGLKKGIGVIEEAAVGENSYRYMASAYYRF